MQTKKIKTAKNPTTEVAELTIRLTVEQANILKMLAARYEGKTPEAMASVIVKDEIDRAFKHCTQIGWSDHKWLKEVGL